MSHHPYTTLSEQILRRVDETLAHAELAADVPSRSVLIILREHVGRENPITRAELADLLEMPDRMVREVIADLRGRFCIAIGSNRTPGASGYFLVSTAEEALELTEPLLHQAFSLLRVARALCGRQTIAEWMGQRSLDLEREDDHAAAA
jgi:hypothetical protein